MIYYANIVLCTLLILYINTAMNLCDWKHCMIKHSPRINKLYEMNGKKYCHNHYKVIHYSLYLLGIVDAPFNFANAKTHKLEYSVTKVSSYVEKKDKNAIEDTIVSSSSQEDNVYQKKLLFSDSYNETKWYNIKDEQSKRIIEISDRIPQEKVNGEEWPLLPGSKSDINPDYRISVWNIKRNKSEKKSPMVTPCSNLSQNEILKIGCITEEVSIKPELNFSKSFESDLYKDELNSQKEHQDNMISQKIDKASHDLENLSYLDLSKKECYYKGCSSVDVKYIYEGWFCDIHLKEIQNYRDRLNKVDDIYSQLHIRILEQEKRKFPHPSHQEEIDNLQKRLVMIESQFINNIFKMHQ